MTLSKKSQIGETAEWIVATFIILFIMIIYVIYVAVAGTLDLSSKEKIQLSNRLANDNGNLESFNSILNSEVKYKDKNLKILEALELSFDKYFETKNSNDRNLIEYYGSLETAALAVNNPLVFNNLKSNGKFNNDELEKIKIDDVEISQVLKSQFDKICNKYILKIPQTVISDNPYYTNPDNRNVAISNDIYYPAIEYNLNYRNQGYKIQYSAARGCFGGPILP